jgi:hypothetical protein
MCSPGDVRLPFYPDYSHHIGEGLTKDDFIITYASSSPKVTVEADGTVHIASGVALYTNFPLEITYTPIVEGVGETTVFACRLRTTAAIKQITPEKTFYRFRNGESVSPIVELHGGDTSMIASVAADGDGLEVTYRQWGTDSIRLHITALKPGLSKVIITAFNGTTAEIEVDVVGEPTQFQFAKEHFICYPGETVDLGLDTGNGPHGLEFYYSYSADVTQDGVSVGGRGFNSMAGTFNAGEAGEYRIVYASGLDRADAAHPHTNFGLSSEGEAVVLSDNEGRAADRVEFNLIAENTAWLRQADGSWVSGAPTPGR